MKTEHEFVVVLVNPRNDEPIFFCDEDGRPRRFASKQGALEATRGAMWEDKWEWYIVRLAPRGSVTLGTRTP
jgi:hypothetical protein